MSALLTVRSDQDWASALVMVGVAAALAVATGLEYAWRCHESRRDMVLNHQAAHMPAEHPASYVPFRAVEVDHQTCTGDGCEATVCFCRQQTTCPGAVNVGCVHITWVGVLCPDCTSECSECRFEAEAARALDIVRGK